MSDSSDWLLGCFDTFHKTQAALFRSITKHSCPWTQRTGAQTLNMGQEIESLKNFATHVCNSGQRFKAVLYYSGLEHEAYCLNAEWKTRAVVVNPLLVRSVPWVLVLTSLNA